MANSAAGLPSVVWSVYAIYLVTVFVTAYYFLKYRDHPGVRSRSLPITCIGVVGNFINSSVYLIGPQLSFLPCFVTMWSASVLSPVLFLATIGKFLRVSFLYKTSLNKLKTERLRVVEQNKITASSTSSQKERQFEASETLLTFDSSTHLKSYSPRILSTSWLNTHSYIFEDRFLIRILGCLILFHMVMTAVIQCLTVNYSFSAPIRDDCLSGWEFIPLYVVGSLEIFVLGPIVIQYIRGVSDAYNIVKELLAIVLTIGCGFSVYLAICYLPQLYDVRFIIPVGAWAFTPLWCVHLLTCGLPLVEIYMTNKRSKCLPRDMKLPSFEEVLDHPVLFERFKAFSVKDFSVENTLFHERYTRLKSSPSTLVKITSSHGLPAELQMELNSIYNSFIKEDSEYQVNLRGETLLEIETRIQGGDFSIDMFETALMEVKLLMYQHTFKRYLQQEFQPVTGAVAPTSQDYELNVIV